VSTQPLLELRRVRKHFGGIQALDDVTFTARAGEVTALVGDNGAGKSTLIKCMVGVYQMDSGSYLLDGVPVTVTSPRAAADLGIEVVYQDLALCDNLDIVQNMFLGREIHHGVFLDESRMETIAAATLRRMSANTIGSLRQPVATLSGGQRQTVAIARALQWNSRVVILDEPTAALGVAQTARVLELIRQLADTGIAVVLISHNLNDVFAVADNIATLYLGQMSAQVSAAQVTYSEVVALITTGSSGKLGLAAVTTPRATMEAMSQAGSGSTR
jgi:D-xylose transport system ATP-binding protein